MNRIIVSDTTLRDGEQAPGCHMSPAQKIRVARQLRALGVDVIEAGFPVSSPAELEAVKAIAASVGRGSGAPVIGGLARSLAGDIDRCWEAVRAARRARIHTFMPSSDIHLKYKMQMSRNEAVRRAVAGIRHASSYTRDVQFSPEDASRADRAFLRRMIGAAVAAGARVINLTDTVGYAVPGEFAELVRDIRARVPNIGHAEISVHCHNDLGMAVANTLAAVRAGATQIECTVNGIGERAGNCALEEVVMALKTRRAYYGAATGVRTRQLSRASRLVSEITGREVPANKAIVGENAFAHASGIHQDGIIQNASTYEIMRPQDVGAESRLPLTSRSGRRAVAARMKRIGIRVPDKSWGDFFSAYKNAADRLDFVNDADLRSLSKSV